MSENQLIIENIEILLDGNWKDVANGKQYKCTEGGSITFFNNGNRSVQANSTRKEIIEEKINEILQNNGCLAGKEPGKIFIVYGHDSSSLEQLELILSKLKVSYKKVLNNTGQTIIEALEETIPEVSCGIVLMTPDDLAISKNDHQKAIDEGKSPQYGERARQNVVLELGMLLSRLGREKVIILPKGSIEHPSDMSGVFYIPYKEHVKETVDKMASRLINIGFKIDAQCLIDAKI